MSQIDVVLVSYNSSRYLQRLSKSMQNSDLILSVTIVDNASADSSVATARALDWGAPLNVIENGSNVGFGAAMNIGAASGLQGNFLLLINPDVELNANTLQLLMDSLVSFPRVACAGGVLATATGESVASARQFPSYGSIARRRVLDTLPAAGVAVGRADWICGALMLWRREVFERVNGFSAEYFLYFEDTDICRKAADLGFEMAVVAAAKAVHDQGHGERPSAELQRYSRQSRRHYAKRWLGQRGSIAAGIADAGDIAARLRRRLGSANS